MGYFISIIVAVVVLCYFVKPFEEEEFLPSQVKFDFSFNTGNHKNFSLVDYLETKLLKQYTTKSGYKIQTYDFILTSAHLRMLQGLTTYKLGSWSYQISEADVPGGQKWISPNQIPWANNLNAVEFSESIVGKLLQKVVAEMSKGGESVYVPYRVVGHIVRCGDSTKVHVDASPDEEEVSMMIYLNEKWRKNDYGDLYLYDDDKEIVAGVVPRYGRVILWQSSIPYLPRPPSVAYKRGQLFLHIQFTKNRIKFNNVHKKWLETKKLREKIQNDGFFGKMEKGDSKTDLESQLVTETVSKEGKRIVIFDDVFSREVLDQLRSVILNYGVYYYDDSYDEESDNVQWIAAFDVDKYVQSRMWGITRDVAKFVSGGHTDWFPYDVSCNLIRSADTTQIHHDCSDFEDEWTFLLYLNPEWSINDYGETVFYEKNDDNTEIITEVLPKYGRVVIFQGIIPHSARPPSRNFTGARLSFAVKLSKNEWTGKLKATQEEMKHFSAVSSMLNFINQRYLNENLREDQSDSDDADSSGDFEPSTENVKLQDMEARLAALTDEVNEMEKLRDLFHEVHASHLEAREQVGDLIRQLL